MTAGVRQGTRDARGGRAGAGRVRLPVVALLAGVGYRLALLAFHAPATNSDEATMGLAALHIARGQDFPVWFYGQSYMGTLEAYLAAPVLALTGPSVFGLRLVTLALYALFVLLAWRLTLRLTGDRWFALLVVALLALGSDRIVKNQLIAGGGYPEMSPAAAALALLTYDLCAGRPGRRLPRWTAWGLLAGLMLWVDPLVLPYVLGAAAVLVAFRRRELRGRAGAVLGIATLAGAAPLLGHSLATGRNPLAAVLAAAGGGAGVPAGWADRLHGGLLLGPPLGMGFCAPGDCATWQLWWAFALPVLLVVGVVSALRVLGVGRAGNDVGGTDHAGSGGAGPDRAVSGRAGSDHAASVRAGSDLGPFPSGSSGSRPSSAGAGAVEGRVGAAVRLALVAAGAATLVAYTVSSSAGRTPVESSRYLSCLLVSLPALLWPLWRAARRLTDGRSPLAGRRVAGLLAAAVLAATVAGTGYATYRAAGTAPAARAAEARHAELVGTLRELGVRHVYGGYWTCNRLTFASGEDVVCAVVDDELRPGFDRYAPYRRVVAASAAPAWIAPTGSPLAARLDERLRAAPGSLYLITIDGYRIYLAHA
ncbi:hypothetical protein E1211_26350 [Micromonospora sp. 15K316]|uniref:hypothetical protein n=1 Tax=Micromonospora sp. 15K316 TaxID=2530376 RepID=UPI001046AF45|nr:hypothetical protein [Micromonospora sp. 15K316]TDC29258.1 hypothetical protein E1211_26350 [Micromonospora sp. 15K316]